MTNMAEIQLMQEAIDINIDFANWLLFQAWESFESAQFAFDNANDLYLQRIESCRAYYNAWKKYTGISLKHRFWSLEDLTEDDFKRLGLEL